MPPAACVAGDLTVEGNFQRQDRDTQDRDPERRGWPLPTRIPAMSTVSVVITRAGHLKRSSNHQSVHESAAALEAGWARRRPNRITAMTTVR